MNEVLRDILSESAEELFWRYTNIKKHHDSVSQQAAAAKTQQQHFNTHQYYYNNHLEAENSLPTS